MLQIFIRIVHLQLFNEFLIHLMYLKYPGFKKLINQKNKYLHFKFHTHFWYTKQFKKLYYYEALIFQIIW